jgi:hypothetical protein
MLLSFQSETEFLSRCNKKFECGRMDAWVSMCVDTPSSSVESFPPFKIFMQRRCALLQWTLVGPIYNFFVYRIITDAKHVKSMSIVWKYRILPVFCGKKKSSLSTFLTLKITIQDSAVTCIWNFKLFYNDVIFLWFYNKISSAIQ